MTNGRVYKDRLEPGSITKLLERLPPEKHSEIKVKAFIDSIPVPMVFNVGLYVITLHAIWRPAPEVLGVRVTVTKGTEQLPVDLEHYWINPPVNVPDGTWNQVVIDGITQEYMNYKEDILEAFKTIVVEDYIKHDLGAAWQP